MKTFRKTIPLFVLLTFSFLGIVAVLKGQYFQIPIVAGIAEKITL